MAASCTGHAGSGSEMGPRGQQINPGQVRGAKQGYDSKHTVGGAVPLTLAYRPCWSTHTHTHTHTHTAGGRGSGEWGLSVHLCAQVCMLHQSGVRQSRAMFSHLNWLFNWESATIIKTQVQPFFPPLPLNKKTPPS